MVLGLANTPEAIVPLIKHWNFPTYTFSVSSKTVRILPSAERLCELDGGTNTVEIVNLLDKNRLDNEVEVSAARLL